MPVEALLLTRIDCPLFVVTKDGRQGRGRQDIRDDDEIADIL